MPSKEMRKTTIGMRSRRRSPLRNEFEVSPQIFWAECSTRWLSAQHFRSIIQPNYHRASAVDQGDLLSMLLTARDEQGDSRGMSDQQLRDEVLTMLLAGNETTAIHLFPLWRWGAAMYRGRFCLDGRHPGPCDVGATLAVTSRSRAPGGTAPADYLASQTWDAHDIETALDWRTACIRPPLRL